MLLKASKRAQQILKIDKFRSNNHVKKGEKRRPKRLPVVDRNGSNGRKKRQTVLKTGLKRAKKGLKTECKN